jgi:RHS repeat-associated protein
VSTAYQFTAQREDASIGSYFYGARYYDAALSRFIQADTLVPAPGDPQSLNRYAYTLNNPLIYRDPTGHGPECMQFAALGPGIGGLAVVGCQVVQAASVYEPQLIQLAINLSEFAASPLAQLALQHAQQVDAAVNQAAGNASNAGNTAGPGGLEPNDPRFRTMMEARTRFESVGEEIVPDVLKAYGGKVGQSGGIPDAFSGRRVTTLGRFPQTEPAGRAGARILNVPNWSLRTNSDWIQEAIRNGDMFHLVTDVSRDPASLLNSNPLFKISAFARELDALLKAGYIRVGDYLVPPL